MKNRSASATMVADLAMRSLSAEVAVVVVATAAAAVAGHLF